METVQVDMDQLAKYIHWKMDQEDMSLREAAKDADVSAATLSRILRKSTGRPRPDVDTLLKLIRWAEIPIDKIVEAPKHAGSGEKGKRDTVEEISVHLRADKNLTAEAARAIAEMVKVAYAQFTSKKRGRA